MQFVLTNKKKLRIILRHAFAYALEKIPININGVVAAMGIIELLLLAVGLSMDAFAVSVCKGLATRQIKFKHYLIIGAWVGGYQALMPLTGYFLGTLFEKYIVRYDHWIAFGLLVYIGGNMIHEALSKDEKPSDASFAFKNMLLLALATSIDALAVGITLALLSDVNIWSSIAIIGTTTFIISAIGLKIGNVFGTRYKSRAELVGGIILILIGCNILFEHLGVREFLAKAFA